MDGCLLGVTFAFCGFLEAVALRGCDVLLLMLWIAFSSLSILPGKVPDPIRMMTAILYLRHVVISGVTLYLDGSIRIWSNPVIKLMSISYGASSFVGMLCYLSLPEEGARVLLSTSSLTCFIVAVMHFGRKIMNRRKRVADLRSSGVSVLRESDLCSANRPSGFAVPFIFPDTLKGGEASTPAPSAPVPSLTEAYLSAVSNDLFYSSETTEPQLTEDFVPPLTPRKLSPCSTMPFTFVRINRLVSEGKISPTCRKGGIIAAGFAGAMGSVVGLSSPPLFLFTTFFDTPSYLFLNILAAHEVPGSVLRLCFAALFVYREDDLYFLLLFLVTYGGGMLLGRKLGGNVLGRKTMWSCYVMLLLCLACMSITTSSRVVIFVLLSCLVSISLVTFVEERSRVHEMAQHYEIQRLRETRQQQALDELRRDHKEAIHRLTGESNVPYWAGYDNDDDRDYLPPHDERIQNMHSTNSEAVSSVQSCEIPVDEHATFNQTSS